MRHFTMEEMRAYDPGAREYADQIAKMTANSDAWRKAHPDEEVLISFNFPNDVCVICPISSAIQRGLVLANDAGVELLKSLWPWGVRREPTVLMVRGIIEGWKP